MCNEKRKRSVCRIIGILVGVLVLLFGYAGQQVRSYASISTEASADAAIVLGAAVWDGQPSPVFAERINHAINLYKHGRVRAIVFTGGKGFGDGETESEIAKRYALKKGVAEEHIHCETSSHITYGNLKGAREIMEQEEFQSALVVSDPYHMRRSMQMAEDLGLDAYASPTPTSRYETWRSKVRFLVRESRLYGIYLLRRRFMTH
jgi:uncharacterized SAM-binding protein YcdF (DUF218 family)